MVLLSSRILQKTARGYLKKVGGERNNPHGALKGLIPGKYPITRTKEYLEQGIVFRDSIKVMAIHYGDYESTKEKHFGMKNIVQQNFGQFQYKNPNTQVIVIKNLTPSPFFTFFLENGEKFNVDVEGKSQFEILSHLQKVVGKPKKLIEAETKVESINPANFGGGYNRSCICKESGQVPCMDDMDILPRDKRDGISGKRGMNMNPKKWPYGQDEDD